MSRGAGGGPGPWEQPWRWRERTFVVQKGTGRDMRSGPTDEDVIEEDEVVGSGADPGALLEGSEGDGASDDEGGEAEVVGSGADQSALNAGEGGGAKHEHTKSRTVDQS